MRRVRSIILPFLLLLAGCFALAGCLPLAEETTKEDKKEPKPPNVVLILTDDLAFEDVNPATLKHMPHLRALMEEGTTFENAFATNSLCCPSRATILRGQYTHNHQILHNQPPFGGAERFRFSGGDSSTMATWLKEYGYLTSFFGKYLNGYSGHYVPPGWDEWYAVSGNFLSNDLNENGHIVSYDADRYHLDDVISDKASAYAEHAARPDPPFFTANRPFLMWIGTKAPHQPATPAPRDNKTYPDVSLPRPPSFDEKDVSDKPGWVSDNPTLSAEQKRYMEELYRKRLQSMLAVDDMIGDLVGALHDSGELDNTYIVFTSEWVAVPVPDSGIPREVVEKAKANIKDNTWKSSKRNDRFWELSGGVGKCGECGTNLVPFCKEQEIFLLSLPKRELRQQQVPQGA